MAVHEFLILPGSLAWDLALEEIPLPFDWLKEAHRLCGDVVFAPRLGGCGLLEPLTLQEAEEYVEDGELEAVEEELSQFEV